MREKRDESFDTWHTTSQRKRMTNLNVNSSRENNQVEEKENDTNDLYRIKCDK